MEVFVARQPIFDPTKSVDAYELLYRSSQANAFDGIDGDTATSRLVVNAFLTIGMDLLTAGKRAFINFTRNSLLNDYATLMPPELVVVEILEDVQPEPDVVAACRSLKERVYTLALDDVIGYDADYEPLLSLADIVKVDFMGTDAATIAHLAARLRPRDITLLAEKVETDDEFRMALELGYTRFQGYFFAKPAIISGTDVPAYKVNYLRLLKEVHQPELDFKTLETIIKSEVALSYKLLKYLNSAAFGWRNRIETIRQALVAVGERELRKWVSMLCLTGMGQDKPLALVVQSIARAHFCEGVGRLIGMTTRSSDFFLTGLFSQLDAIMGRPLDECLNQLSLAGDVQEALTARSGPFGSVLAGVTAYEQADWPAVDETAQTLGLSKDQLSDCYVAALRQTDAMFQGETELLAAAD